LFKTVHSEWQAGVTNIKHLANKHKLSHNTVRSIITRQINYWSEGKLAWSMT